MSEELAWETVGTRTAYTCEGFDVVTDAVRFPDGSEGEYDYFVEGESVVVLPFTADSRSRGRDRGRGRSQDRDRERDRDRDRERERDGTDGEVVVIEEWRQAVGRVNRGLPAGSVEPDDATPKAAVARELEEETGYRPGSVERLTTVEPANGFADAVFHYFLARDCEPSGEQDHDYNEDIRVGTTTLDDLLAAARTDDLRDGRSMLGVLYYALFRDRRDGPIGRSIN